VLLDSLIDHGLEFWAGVCGLAMYTSAYIAEVIRSGINTIHYGEIEAALAFGFHWTGVFRQIIIPQALRTVLPPLTNQFLNLVKNSSLAMTVGVAELTFMVQQIESETFRGFEAAIMATFIYVSFSLFISTGTKYLERRWTIPGLNKP